MNRSSDPELRRMPGSAILVVVFFALQAIGSLIAGFALHSLIPQGLAVLLILGGVLNAAIAIGVAMQRRWARIVGILLCAAAITLSAIDLLFAAAEGVPTAAGAGFGLLILLLFFLSHRNTRAWCNDLEPTETALGPAEPESFTYRDQVELLKGIDEIGLRANAVGTVVDLPAEPEMVVVEFDDHPDREPIQVKVHVDEIRLVAETE